MMFILKLTVMQYRSELERVLFVLSNNRELVKNTLAKLSKQFKIKYGNVDHNNDILVAEYYTSITDSPVIIVDQNNFNQIINERLNKGLHLLLYHRIVSGNIDQYYRFETQPIPFGEDLLLCLVNSKVALNVRIDYALNQLLMKKINIPDYQNAKTIIKDHLTMWKDLCLINDDFEIDYKDNITKKIKAIHNLFANHLHLEITETQLYIDFIESLFNKRIDNKETWRKTISRNIG